MEQLRHSAFQPSDDSAARIARLERQVLRERTARLEAEAIAERGLRELYESQQWLSLVQRITTVANTAKEPGESLSAALREICAQLNWDFGNALFVEHPGQTVRADDIWFAAEPVKLFEFIEVSRRRVFATGLGLPGRVLRDGCAHWIADVREDDNFQRRDEARNAGLVSACAFPIVIGREIVAIFEFFSWKTVVESEALLDTMAQIGIQLGRVIERDRGSKALLHDALHDSLSGLPNRVMLTQRMREAEQRCAPDYPVEVLVVDLDGFKAVNDKYGHFIGDELLVECATRLRRAVEALAVQCSPRHGTRSTIARVGGDEFVILLEGRGWTGPARLLPQAIHDALGEPCVVQEDLVTVGASIGVAQRTHTEGGIEQMLRDADLAMYEAKAQGRGRTVIFSDALGNAIRARREIELELRLAIRGQQFCLHYQPINACDEAATVRGYEALLRWQHPRLGLVSPAQFLPVAEESGLIIYLGDWVLEEACRAIARLHRRGAPFAQRFISVNVAAIQFLQPSFPRRVSQLVMEHAINPRQLRLEITESVAIIDPLRTRKVLQEIREWGVQTSLDDFGTGYSSLSYLKRLPFDSLKIDKSFIDDLSDPKSVHIVKAILDLARSMDLTVVAEGIERTSQRDLLSGMGCDLLQGYLFGRPVCEASAFAR